MSTILLRKKSTKYNLIRSLSEGGLSVQNVCAVAMIVLLAGYVDLYWCSTLARMFLCIAIVYNWPCSWVIAACSVVIATIVHQAGAEEIMMCALIVALLRYARIRMVNTDFSHHVLIGMGYLFMETLSYLTTMSVTLGELGSHIAVAGMLFLLYTITS